jgi:hypothetical protein
MSAVYLEGIDPHWLSTYLPGQSIFELKSEAVAARKDIPVKIRHQLVLYVKNVQSLWEAMRQIEERQRRDDQPLVRS